MAKMTYEEAIAFMEQHAIYCETGTRPDWHAAETEALPRKPVYWIRLAEYMNKKREAEQVLNTQMQKMLSEMLESAASAGTGFKIEVRNGQVVSASLIQPGTDEPDADDLTNIRPVGGIQ